HVIFNNSTIFTNIYPLEFGQLYYCCTFSLISIFLCVLVNHVFCGVDKATCEVNKATQSSSKYALRQKTKYRNFTEAKDFFFAFQKKKKIFFLLKRSKRFLTPYSFFLSFFPLSVPHDILLVFSL
ncbi:hypothetical protein TorRG33x02_010720, partial [Trema orientale]